MPHHSEKNDTPGCDRHLEKHAGNDNQEIHADGPREGQGRGRVHAEWENHIDQYWNL
jgi:hypothetical protein